MFEGLFQPMHLLVILVIALRVFGPRKLGDIGKSLGEGIRAFRQGARDDEPTPEAKPPDEGTTQASAYAAVRKRAVSSSRDRFVYAESGSSITV